jgi:CBS-domain-containing membrane protein
MPLCPPDDGARQMGMGRRWRATRQDEAVERSQLDEDRRYFSFQAVEWKWRLQPKGHEMIAADIMTCDVATVQPGDTVLQAVQLMLDRQVSGLPVLDISGKLVGIMTEGDLLRRVETNTELHPSWLQSFFQPAKLAERFVKANGRHVTDVMQRDVVTAEETTPLEDVVALMEAEHIKRLPVLRGGALVGIIARADLVRALGHLLQTRAAPLTDAKITEQLHAILSKVAWTPHDITCAVADGRVQLYGTLFDERERGAIRVTAENMPGVVSVTDHLLVVEANSGVTFDPDVPAALRS